MAIGTDISLPLLSRIQIASPCPAKWEEMAGDERTRHCARCDLDVHNISEMTEAAAEAFLLEKLGSGERVCGRIFRRVDGTILTKDCPVGLALWRKRARWAAGRVAAAVVMLVGGGAVAIARNLPYSNHHPMHLQLSASEPFRSVSAWMNPVSPAPPARLAGPVGPGRWLGGVVCEPAPGVLKAWADLRAAKIAERVGMARALLAEGNREGAEEWARELLREEPGNKDAIAVLRSIGGPWLQLQEPADEASVVREITIGGGR